MSQILVRQLRPEAHRALKARAKIQKSSAEAVAREILERTLLPDQQLGLGDRISAVWEGADLTDVEIDRSKEPYIPAEPL
jgi:plasmid stability protein